MVGGSGTLHGGMLWFRLLLLCAVKSDRGAALLSAYHPPPPPPANASALPPVRAEGLVRAVDRIYHGGGKVGYLLYLDGKRFQLDLERDEAVPSRHFSPQYVLPVMAAPFPRECVHRGTVDGDPESLAVFSLCGGELRGLFAVGHARYTITPVVMARGREHAGGALHRFTRDSFSFEAAPLRDSCGTREGRRRRRRRHRGGRDGAIAASPLADAKRRRRSVSRARYVELLLVADESMTKKYGKDLHHYLLTLASIASKLYGHASIENPVRLSVVKVTTVTEKDRGLEVSSNAAATLKSFCKWQNQQNPLDDDHQHHHDAAILFT
ncbi:A disintegrin and metalloproteinase with thrombospondin motifs 5-like, partial [Lampris incognitus]|uniref:A disintegrin and metalloproteinase with thrombospondin motifs 5-like n=1 Tax=Lampris incognitus TaxID=2546036 RepID=UPI0024B5CDEA